MPSKEHPEWQQTRKLLSYRESTHTILGVTCPNIPSVIRLYKILVYHVPEHIINTTSMYTIRSTFIPYIDGPLRE